MNPFMKNRSAHQVHTCTHVRNMCQQLTICAVFKDLKYSWTLLECTTTRVFFAFRRQMALDSRKEQVSLKNNLFKGESITVSLSGGYLAMKLRVHQTRMKII